MGKRSYLIYTLSDLINKGETENSDTLIAKALLSLRNEIGTWTLDDIAAKFFISQSAISRFIRKLGYRSYSEFRMDLQAAVYTMEKFHPDHQKTFEEASTNIYSQMHEITESFKNLKKEEVENVRNVLSESQNICFIGSELSMCILRLIQVKLLSKGKNVYTFYNYAYQNEILSKGTEYDLLIAVSMGERWFSTFNRQNLESFKGRTMLWTVKENHRNKDDFDDVIMMGETSDPNLGYHYLMQFVLLISEIL